MENENSSRKCEHTRLQHVGVAALMVKDLLLVGVAIGSHKLSKKALSGLTFKESMGLSMKAMFPKESGSENLVLNKETTVADVLRQGGYDPDEVAVVAGKIVPRRERRG